MLLQGKYIDVDIIKVSYEDFDKDHKININAAIANTREVYSSIGLGIRRITHSGISRSEAGSLANINSRREMKQLTRKYRGPGPGIDVFFVLGYRVDGAAGSCRIGFNDNKNLFLVNGCVIGIINIFWGDTQNTMAHEIGHALGLKHQDNDPYNLMFQGSGGSKLDKNQWYKGRKRSQVSVIYDSDWIRNGCEIER